MTAVMNHVIEPVLCHESRDRASVLLITLSYVINHVISEVQHANLVLYILKLQLLQLDNQKKVRISNMQKPILPYMHMLCDVILDFRLSRVANDDITIQGIKIPKGTLIHVPVWSIHHSEENYSDPDTFNPERYGYHF